MAFIYDLADEWTDSGTTYAGIKLNVTDTASGASSLLMDLEVGGSSKFKVSKGGDVTVAPESSVGSSINSRTLYRLGSEVQIHYGGRFTIFSGTEPFVGGGGAQGIRASYFRFGHLTSAYMIGEANDAIAQRNGANAQTFNLYNTYTDASNYERGFMKWSSNELNIGTEATGTGTARSLRITSATGQIGIYNGASRYWLFQLGTSARSFTPSADIVGDIGAASLRIRDFYVGRNVFLSGLPTTDPVSAGQLWNDAGTLKVSAG